VRGNISIVVGGRMGALGYVLDFIENLNKISLKMRYFLKNYKNPQVLGADHR